MIYALDVNYNDGVNSVVTNEVIVKLMRSMETVRLDLTAVTQCTVIDVKQMLQKEWGILPQDQTLMHNGLKLPEECNLFDCGVVEKSELELIVSSHCKCIVDVHMPDIHTCAMLNKQFSVQAPYTSTCMN